jgi:SAM-dependent MidA family methyltransferase
MIPSSALPPAVEGSDSRLLEELRRLILDAGAISFARFMELALYHPRWGYYSRAEDPVGRSEQGDYYTSPARHSAFGSLIGRQVAQCLEIVGGSEREWVELGPGGGQMAASLLEELRRRGLGPAAGVRFTLVESNPQRRAAQENLLRERKLLEGVRWLTPGEWEQSRQALRGCLVANEVLDALPVHRLIFRDGRFQEIKVGWDGGLVEVVEPLCEEALMERALADCPEPREGQELEVGIEAERMVRALGSRLERGYAIFLDYGYLTGERFSAWHQRGTLLAYHRHLASERYLERVGCQDLTAHVNFTALLEAAQQAGLSARGPVPQGRLLLALGALDWLAKSGEDSSFEDYRSRKAVQDLFLPGGMGETHQAVFLATQGCDLDLQGLQPMERWEPPQAG